MEIDYREIYRAHAAEYDRLVAAEDHEGNLARALEAVVPRGARVLEVGAGTGRITAQLLERGAQVTATEVYPAMAEVARARLAAHPPERWTVTVADARSLPTADAWADAAVAGWVIGHFREWHAPHWREAAGQALAEMRRSLVPGGVLVVVETLGTGADVPAPPSPELAEYYRWLEEEHGFARTAIRTDYRFADPAEGAALLRLFFGAAMADAFVARGGSDLPECTGIWTRRVE